MHDTKTILLVDDESAIRMLLGESLTRRGYTTITAANGIEALRASNGYQESIDVLVSDVMMPGMTGFQLARELCAARPELKVILISGFSEAPAELEDSWEFLQKPFSPGVLCDRLDDLCDRRRCEEMQREGMRRRREYDWRLSLQLDTRAASHARTSARHTYAEAVRSFEAKK